MRTFVIFAAVIAVGAAVGIGLKQAGSSDEGDATLTALKPTAEETAAALSGSPPALAALHRQAGQLLPGGRTGLQGRLRELRGHPVVVNLWASWCGPCRAEMPVLQRVALQRGRSVAFVGVDIRDNRQAAKDFLREFPLSYPSYEDPDGKVYNAYGLRGAPSTVFYDATGRTTFTHQGQYLSRSDLDEDIDRYALGTPTAATS